MILQELFYLKLVFLKILHGFKLRPCFHIFCHFDKILHDNLNFLFQNPYYIDGDVKLTQSMTIMKYLGRKYDLAPVTEEEHQRVDLIEAEAIDMRGAWGRTCYNPDFVIVSEFRQPRQLLRGMSNPTGKSAR